MGRRRGGRLGQSAGPPRQPEEERPVAIRYGHLPKDLPDWFHDYDATKDGQIALHEWLKGAKAAGETASVESFAVYDLNHDQLITAEEVLRYDRLQADAKRIAAIQQGESTRPSLAVPVAAACVGPGGLAAASSRICMSGSNSDKSVSSTERGKGNRDSDKKPDKKSESSERTEKTRTSEHPRQQRSLGHGGQEDPRTDTFASRTDVSGRVYPGRLRFDGPVRARSSTTPQMETLSIDESAPLRVSRGRRPSPNSVGS